MPPNGRSTENTFNVALGNALIDTTARWREDTSVIHVEETQVLSGQGSKGKRPDVLIGESTSPPLVIETSYSPSDAERDAIARLGEQYVHGSKVISTAFAVHIPEEFRQKKAKDIELELKSGAEIRYVLHQSISKDGDNENQYRRWPSTGWMNGSLADLSSLLAVAVLPREKVEQVAEEVAEIVNSAAIILSRELNENEHIEVAELVQQRSPLSGLRTAMVLWLNALLIQHRLRRQGVADAGELDFSISETPNPLEHVEAWRKLLDHNWESIFEPAVEVLIRVGNSHPQATSDALKSLIRAVFTIELARLGLYINLGAELFPLLSSDRKEAAAFYTQAGTAELLASLTIERSYLSKSEWASDHLFERVVMGDLSCGTGTLLRAGYRRVMQFHEQSGGSLKSAACLHKDAMERGLVGTDISPIAAHLTAASLAALGSGEPYGETRIGWVKVGDEDGATGSLEYLQRDELDDLLSTFGGRSSGTEQSRSPVAVLEESLDWVLMNPPYSRTRGGQSTFDVAGLSKAERLLCQKRWGELIRREAANKTAGMAASFLVLASKKVKQGGRIGFVLPRTAAFAESWKSTRQMVIEKFEDILLLAVESGTALGQDAFSKDTDMEEMLLVATRRTEDESCGDSEECGSESIFSVALRSSPVQSGEATEIGRLISEALERVKQTKTGEPIYAGSEEIGSIDVIEIPSGGQAWSHVGVTNAQLMHSSKALADGRLSFGNFNSDLGVSLVAIEEQFEVGSTHHLIGYVDGQDEIGAFRFFPISSRIDELGRDRSIWRTDATSQNTLILPPTHKGIPNTLTSDESRARIRETSGTLHIQRNMRWTSQAILAASTSSAVLGGPSWTTILCEDTRVLKALGLWMNSTLGMLAYWSVGQRTHAGRARLQIMAIRKLVCPQLHQLDSRTLDWAQVRFTELCNDKLLPACQAHCDPNRKKIDDAVISMLNLPNEANGALDKLRQVWCAEPSVHGRNKVAVRLLSEHGLL